MLSSLTGEIKPNPLAVLTTKVDKNAQGAPGHYAPRP